MRIFIAMVLLAVSAAPAQACKYVQLFAKPSLSAAQKADLQKDQLVVDQLRRDMSTVCATTKTAAINSCQHSKGMCADLSYEEQTKFRYDVGADGSLRGMVSPEERTKNAETINRIYEKWKS